MFLKPLIYMISVTALFVSASTNAAQIDFGVKSPTGGSISFAGGTASLIGTGIDVDDIVGLGTPLNSGGTPIVCDNCKLSFTTGSHTGSWNFGSGGSIQITGGVSAAGITDTSSVLLSGTFDNAVVINLTSKIAAGAFLDTKHPDLLAYFGMPSGGYAGGLNLSFNMQQPPAPIIGGAFNSSVVLTGDIVNAPVVPIPAAVWLFVSGLFGLVGMARRKARV